MQPEQNARDLLETAEMQPASRQSTGGILELAPISRRPAEEPTAETAAPALEQMPLEAQPVRCHAPADHQWYRSDLLQ